MAEEIALRGHHFLCLLTYIGRGYSREFVENLDAITARLNQGTPVRIVSGPDDICGPEVTRCGANAHCHLPRAMKRDAVALRAVTRQIGPIGKGFRLTRPVVGKLRAAFRDGAIRTACTGCEWHALCTEIAESGFDGARLMPR